MFHYVMEGTEHQTTWQWEVQFSTMSKWWIGCVSKIFIHSHPNTYTWLMETCSSYHSSELVQSSQGDCQTPSRLGLPPTGLHVGLLGDESTTPPNIFLWATATRHPLRNVKRNACIFHSWVIKDSVMILLLPCRALLPGSPLTSVFQHYCFTSPYTWGHG